jgi:cardiolipin synthase
VDLTLPASLARGLDATEYVAEPGGLSPGNRTTVLIDGAETFPAMLDAIAAARHYVHLETYIFEADAIGERFADSLTARARAGVEVRVILDSVGTFSLPASFIANLRAEGVQVVEYGQLRSRRKFSRWLRRDHRKILVTDGELGFVGGINIGLDYASREVGGRGWRDTHARIAGPVVADLETMFHTTWELAGGAPFPHKPRVTHQTLAGPDSEWAMALGSDHRGRRSDIRRNIMHAVRRARHTIHVNSAYFVPDRAMRRSFVAAAQRGVDVRIIVPAESDLRSVQWAGEYTYAGLLRGGVHLHQWQGSHMHAKTMVVDGVWSMIGSYNLDYVSLFMNMEVVIAVAGEPTAKHLEQAFATDLERSPEIELGAWLERSWWQRGLAWLFYRFRRLL